MKKILPFLILVSVLISCNDDDAERTISITIQSTTVYLRGTKWAFISDREGKPLDYAELTGDGTVNLHIPNHIAEETVTLSFFSSGSSSFSKQQDLISFSNVGPGEYSLFNSRTGTLPTTAQLTLQNISEDINIIVGGQGNNMLQYENVFSLSLKPGTNNKAKVLITGINKSTGDGRFQVLDIAANENVTLDYNAFSALNKSEINVAGDYCQVSQYVVIDGFECRMRGAETFLESTTPMPISLYSSPTFDSYITNIRVSDGNETYSNITYGTNPPAAFERLDAEIELDQNDESGIVMNLTGNSDLVTITYSHEVENRWEPDIKNTRMYNMPFSTTLTFRHPQIPAEILTAIGADDTTIGELDAVSLTDYESFQNYSELLSNILTGYDTYTGVKSSAKWKTKEF